MTPPKTTYRIIASREGVEIELDENFWNNAVVRPQDGTTALDIYIATLVQEIRTALYFLGTEGTRH